jgi:hypothetical protein
MGQVQQLLDSGRLIEVEQLVDRLAMQDPASIAREWNVERSAVPLFISHFYNTIGTYYQHAGREENKQGNRNGVVAAARNAERCHEKAFDLFDLAADDVLAFPSKPSPFTKNFIYTFWGLGATKYALEKQAESRKYLLLCLWLTPDDDQARKWQDEASTYLSLLERKPVRIALRVHKVVPSMFESQVFFVEGELLEWEEYTKPTQERYMVHVTDEDIARLEARGLKNALALRGRVVVLNSDPCGDLRRKMRLVEVA